MSDTFFEVKDLTVSYGPLRALTNVSFEVGRGAALAVLGANGAGKSTLARALSALVPVVSGHVYLDGTETTRLAAHEVARLGVCHVPEGRGIFPSLTVADNLRMALMSSRKSGKARAEPLSDAYELFPVLRQRLQQRAGTLSGGEQQMLAMSRALVGGARLIIADELSLGLAPRIVGRIFETLAIAKERGMSIIVIEQFVDQALKLADHCVVLQGGEMAWSGPADRAGEEVLARYLGRATAAVEMTHPDRSTSDVN
jgi:branched-chain amino acid transport system ATP-binding protein